MVFLPAYSPELQPAERLWLLVNEPIANQAFERIEQVEELVYQRCRRLLRYSGVDQHLGEAAKAIVVLHQGVTATEEELIGFCQRKLDRLECPRSVDFVAALPRNSTGKVLKLLLQEPYWTEHQH